MSSHIRVNIKYAAREEADYGGGLEVSKFCVRKAGWRTSPDTMFVQFEGEGYLNKAQIYLEPEIAIPLARSLLSVAEGYVSESESEVAWG